MSKKKSLDSSEDRTRDYGLIVRLIDLLFSCNIPFRLEVERPKDETVRMLFFF